MFFVDFPTESDTKQPLCSFRRIVEDGFKSFKLYLTHNSSSRSTVSPPVISPVLFTLCIGNCQTFLINYQVQSACRANRIDVTVLETREITFAAQAYIPAHIVNGLHITHLKLTFKSDAQKVKQYPFLC